jgi:hypothetical protein
MSQSLKYVVRLSAEERQELQQIVDQGWFSKSVRQHCRILLKADEGEFGPAWEDTRVMEFAEVSLRTVERVRKRLVTEGFEAAVHRKPATDRQYRKLDGAGEARLIAAACSTPPEDRNRWTLKLLAEELVALEVVDCISRETVRQVLKKTNSSRTCESNG